MKLWRSMLFVAANDPVRLGKVTSRGADAVIMDLEDAVAAEAKPQARVELAQHIAALRNQGSDLVVRINSPWEDAKEDIDAAVTEGLDALMIPKVECVESVAPVAELIGELETQRGLPQGSIGIVALIESPLALKNLYEIAAHDRVIGLALGTEDFSLELGVTPSPACLELPSKLVALAAASYGRMALAVPISITVFGEIEKYREAASFGRAFGVTGAICIHPKQVQAANEVFGITEQERVEAEAIMAAWKLAQSEGRAVASHDGKMIDLPVAERARRILETPR